MKSKTIEDIIAENLKDGIELNFVIDLGLLRFYNLLKEYLSYGNMEYKFTIVAQFKYKDKTYKFYVDRKGTAYQLWIYVLNSERYVLQRQYIGNINPKCLLYFENVLKYVNLFSSDNTKQFSIYEPLFWLKILDKRFDTTPKYFREELSDSEFFGNEHFSQEPAIISEHELKKQILAVGLGKVTVNDYEFHYYHQYNRFLVTLYLNNDYYHDGKKIEEKEEILKLIKKNIELKIDKYFSIGLDYNLIKSQSIFDIEAKYSKHYLTFDGVINDSIKMIAEVSKLKF